MRWCVRWMTTVPAPASGWPPRPMRSRSSGWSVEQNRKAEDACGRTLSPGDTELAADQAANKTWMARYNGSLAVPLSERHALLSERLAHVGADVVIRPPFFCDYGYNISLGDGLFLKFNCVILDVVEVSIGDRTQIGPAVQIYAADHPRDAETRRSGLEFGRPVRIGKDVWIGGGAIILPGVTKIGRASCRE